MVTDVNRLRAKFLTGVVASLLLLCAGCSSLDVRVTQEAEADLASRETYAFRLAVVPDGDAVDEKIRRAVDGQLQALGLRSAQRDQAELVVDWSTAIEERTSYKDPYYAAFYSAERYELGTLTLTMRDPETGRVLWEGSTVEKLRDVARGYGVNELRFVETNEERYWQIDQRVEALIARFRD